jgi:NitT/TauT family transport system permease protein
MVVEYVSPSEERQSNTVHKNQNGWRLFGIGVVVAWLLIWQAVMQLELLNPVLFPSPSAIVRGLYRSLLVTGELRIHLWLTITRLLGGFIIGALPALWFGLRMGRNPSADLRYGLFFATVGLIPMLASLPFLIIMFGVGERQKWVMVAAAVFYPVLYCTKTGVRISRASQRGRRSSDERVDRGEWQHGAGPWIFTGLKLGSLIGLASLLAGEVFVSTRGLGFEIGSAMAILHFERAYTGMFAVALVVYALWLSFTGIEFALSRRSEMRKETRLLFQ